MVQQRLDRAQVVESAIAFVDACGLDELTMRRLGTALDVEAMALYRHVSGRADLLEAMVDELIDGLFDDELMTEDSQSWEEYLQRVANATRNLACAHPRIFPLIATQPPEAPWLRPPLRSVRWVEDFLSSLLRFGFSDAQAVAAYKAFTSFLVGALLLQVASTAPEILGRRAKAIPRSLPNTRLCSVCRTCSWKTTPSASSTTPSTISSNGSASVRRAEAVAPSDPHG